MPASKVIILYKGEKQILSFLFIILFPLSKFSLPLPVVNINLLFFNGLEVLLLNFFLIFFPFLILVFLIKVLLLTLFISPKLELFCLLFINMLIDEN